jgi:hypothetical protein
MVLRFWPNWHVRSSVGTAVLSVLLGWRGFAQASKCPRMQKPKTIYGALPSGMLSKLRPCLSRLDERGRQILIASGHEDCQLWAKVTVQTLLARRLSPLSMVNPIALVRVLSTVVSLRCIQMRAQLPLGLEKTSAHAQRVKAKVRT